MGKRLVTSGIARCFLGAAILAMSCQPAMAQTTTLVCHIGSPTSDAVIEDEPTTIELNEAQSSVVVHFGANHANVDPAMAHAARSIGPLPAAFGADAIDFSDPYQKFTINRLTGAFVQTFNTGGEWRWTCQAGKKQF